MRYIKYFEMSENLSIYDKLYIFFNEIKLKGHHVERYDFIGYSYVGIYLYGKLIIKLSDYFIHTIDVDKYYPYLYEYLESKLPMVYNKVIKENIDSSVTFSMDEYKLYNNIFLYNL